MTKKKVTRSKDRVIIFKYSKEHFRMIEDEWWKRYNLNTNTNR